MSVFESIKSFFSVEPGNENIQDKEKNIDGKGNLAKKSIAEANEDLGSDSDSISQMDEDGSDSISEGNLSEVTSDDMTDENKFVADIDNKDVISEIVVDESENGSVILEFEDDDDFTRGDKKNVKGNQDNEINVFGIVSCRIKYDVKKSLLFVTVINVRNCVKKEDGGPSNYQLHMVTLPDKKNRWKSKELQGSILNVDESTIFKDITSDSVSDTAIRFRLYALENGRMNRLLSESIQALSSLKLKGEEGEYSIHLEERSISKALRKALNNRKLAEADERIDKIMESEDKKLMENTQRRILSRLMSMKNFSILDSKDQKDLSKAELILQKNSIDWPELQTSIAYNSISGRLSVRVIRASNLNSKRPLSTFVLLVLRLDDEKIISKRSTDFVKNNNNPNYEQTIIMELPSNLAKEATLMIYVCRRNVVFKNNVIGWLGLGKNNSGKEEQDHWDDILKSDGEFVTRNHQIHTA